MVKGKVKKQTMLEKWNSNAPYYIFFNKIPEFLETYTQKNSIRFSDLLCPSLGKLKATLQINYVVDFEWLMNQYQFKHVGSLPITIVGGDESLFQEYMEENISPQITHYYPNMERGLHHTKIGILLYDDDSLRVIVSTANLYQEDWDTRNQAVWLSPRCPPMNDASTNNGDSPTGFKCQLLKYLKGYDIECLKPWIKQVESVDFKDIRVFLITSSPGTYYSEQMSTHHHSVAGILRQHCTLPDKTHSKCKQNNGEWPVIAQASAVGKVGYDQQHWFQPILKALSGHTGLTSTMYPYALFKFIFPSVKNVDEGIFESITLQYDEKLYEKQKWFQRYMYQWKADRLDRSEAMPHIKTYARVSPCYKKMAYFLLTSANFSYGGWGSTYRNQPGIQIKSYEAGVLFLPKFFDEEYFEISETDENKNGMLFPVMYDFPLTPYAPGDKPFTRSNK